MNTKMKNQAVTQRIGLLRSRKGAPSLLFLAKGGRELNGVELYAAGRAAVTPGSRITKVVDPRRGTRYLDEPWTTAAPPGMPAAAPSHKVGCRGYLGGQGRKECWTRPPDVGQTFWPQQPQQGQTPQMTVNCSKENQNDKDTYAEARAGDAAACR